MQRNVVPWMIVFVLLALVTLAPSSPSLAAEVEQGLVKGLESDNAPELTAAFSYAIDGLTVFLTDSSSASTGVCPIILWTWEIDYPSPRFDPVEYEFDSEWSGEFDHTFELYGAYNISLTVKDKCGATDTVTQRITVTKGRLW